MKSEQCLHDRPLKSRRSVTRDDIVNLLPAPSLWRYSNAKMRCQSFFMLITVQPSFFASAYSACVKAPTFGQFPHGATLTIVHVEIPQG